MSKYCVEDFLGKSEPTTFKKEVAKKIDLLYDFCILKRSQKARDKREKEVKKILLQYNNETRMNNVVHDLLTGKYTIDRLIAKNMLN